MQYETAVISHKGGRDVNQDYAAFSKSTEGGCWVLADGLGGHQAGEIAAKLAVDTLLQEFQQNYDSQWMQAGIEKAQAALQLQQESGSIYRSMRTTLVALACKKDQATWAHVGDSRLYHLREGKILSQTKDHSVCQALVNAGEITISDIRFHEDRNRLYRVLGSEGHVRATIQKEEIRIQPGDAFFLCSDGFWEYVTEEEIESTRMRASAPFEWLQMMESILQERISEKNDNYSGIVVFVCDEKN